MGSERERKEPATMWVELLLVILSLLLAVYWYVTKHFGYFTKHGISEEAGTFPFGSNAAWECWLKGKSFLKFFDDSNEKYKEEKMYGVYHFGQRNLVVTDLELAKLMLVKDADHFTESFAVGTEYKDAHGEIEKLFSLMLTNMKGDEWKKMRAMVSPVFTSGKLKLMVPHIVKCGTNIEEHLKTAAMTGEVLEAREMFGKFTLDSIATSGFGIESNSFKDPENIFRINAMKVVRDPQYAAKLDILKFIILMISPKIAKLLGIYMLDKNSTSFFMNIVRQTIKNRRETGAKRNDIIDIFIDELDKKREDCFLSETDLELGIVATAILFFFAGFDTTSTTLAVTVFGLVHHPDVQDNLRKEIEDVIGDSEEITANHLKELKYTENVVNESLRYYFKLPITRRCTKDYPVPGTDFTVPKGLMVNFPPGENCFKNQDKFDPDNFDPENNPNKFGFTGFGQGPRNCIGQRYAYQTLKIAIIHTVRNFRLVKCSETTKEDALNFSLNENGFVGGIKFKVERLQEE